MTDHERRWSVLLPDAVVQAQLKKILISQTFAHSERLRRFLRYCVEQAIQGHPENLREYAIGMEVFDRRVDYQPSSDPIVRVEARRLRSKLKDYYLIEGQQDSLIIDVPKGSYLPSFQPRQERTAPRTRVLIGSVAATAAIFGGVWWIARQEAPAPRLTLSRLTSDSGLTTDAAISTDGALIAYASDRGGKGDLDIWVAQVAGGEAIQLTRDPADDRAPSFSPDGTTLLFRSERAPPGVYSVPALGGEAKLIVRDGEDPRFSPDAKWIAYWVGSGGGDFLPPAGKIYAIPARGGAARQLCAGFSSAAFPVWSPDGSQLLFEGTRDPPTKPDRDFDWWTVSINDDTATRTGAFDVLAKRRLRLPQRRRGAAWAGGKLVFAASSGDSTSLWELPLRGKAPQRLTLGASSEIGPSIASNGTIAFSSLAETVDVWSLRINADRGEMASWMERVTEAAAHSVFPSASSDGSRVVYLSSKAQGNGIWIKNLQTRQELALGHPNARYPRISRDGTRVAFLEGRTLFAMPSSGGEATAVCGECGRPWDWSPDGTRILYVEPGSPSAVGELTLASGAKRILLRHDRDDLANPQFSPDGRSIGFHAIRGPAQRQIFISAYPAGANWVAVTDGGGLDRNCAWSPDGSVLYYISERDGFRCIWAQRLEGPSKKAAGEAFAVAHFHSARRSLFGLGDVGAIGLAAVPGKLIFSLSEVSGNVWMAREESRP